MAGFGNALASMDAAIMASLKDGQGDYRDANGRPVAADIELIIDRNLQHAGANGVFLSSAVGITCRKAAVGNICPRGLFVFEGVRYQVAEIIEDDGHMLTAACMEVP